MDDLFGNKGIDFDTHPGFSKKCILKGPDETAIRKLFTADVLHHFENIKVKVMINADKNTILFFNFNRKVNPKDLRTFLTSASEVVNIFKRTHKL